MKSQFFLAGALVLSLSAVPVLYAADQPADQPSSAPEQQSASEPQSSSEPQGGQDPGMSRDNQSGLAASDMESTEKKRDPGKAHKADKNAQVTLGGAKSTVTGEITKIQNEYFFVKEAESGDEVRLLVNRDTNIDCGTVSTSAQNEQEQKGKDIVAKSEQSQGASPRQQEQGQKKDETAMGHGFKVGACSFNPGEIIKAEVDDNGRVTTLKFVTAARTADLTTARPGESAGTGELAKPGEQEKAGALDMTTAQGFPPKAYSILPVPVGKLKATKESAYINRPVKDLNGKVVGKIENFIIDSHSGQVEYAIVSLKDDKDSLQAVPWVHFTLKQDAKKKDAEKKDLVLNTKDYQLGPELTKKNSENQSPEIDKLIKQIQQAKAAPDLREDHPQKSASKEHQAEAKKDMKGTLVRGRILEIEGEFLEGTNQQQRKAGETSMLVKDFSAKKDVRLHIDKRTQKGTVNLKDDPFKVGDKIEAYVGPDGHALSISLMRTQGAAVDDPEGGG